MLLYVPKDARLGPCTVSALIQLQNYHVHTRSMQVAARLHQCRRLLAL
jgi:hypothetical protein